MAHQSNRSAPLYGIRCSRSAMRPHQTGAPTHNRHQDDTRRRKRRANLSATLKCFLVVSGSGAGLWAALALGAGWLLQGAVQGAISVLDQHAGGALLITTGLVASWLGWKTPAPSRPPGTCSMPDTTQRAHCKAATKPGWRPAQQTPTPPGKPSNPSPPEHPGSSAA